MHLHLSQKNPGGVRNGSDAARRIGVCGFFSDLETNKATNEYYEVWSKSIHANEAIKTLADYYDIKYNDSPRYELLQKYVSSVESGYLSPLSGFDLYEQYYNTIQNELVGIEVGGVTITGQTQHFLERVFGCMKDPKNGHPRNGVELDDILNCVKNLIQSARLR